MKSPYEQKIFRKRIKAFIISSLWLLVDAIAEAAIAFMVLWVAMPDLSTQTRELVVIFLALSTLWSFLAGWNANRVHKMNLDLWIREADPLELEVFIKGAQNQKQFIEQMVDVTPSKLKIPR